jgi:hypothetical protein
VAQRQGGAQSFASAVAAAVTQGGDAAVQSFGAAFAQASAAGGDQAQGLVQVRQTVDCAVWSDPYDAGCMVVPAQQPRT